jgi:hypothetical protein
MADLREQEKPDGSKLIAVASAFRTVTDAAAVAIGKGVSEIRNARGVIA